MAKKPLVIQLKIELNFSNLLIIFSINNQQSKLSPISNDSFIKNARNCVFDALTDQCAYCCRTRRGAVVCVARLSYDLFGGNGSRRIQKAPFHVFKKTARNGRWKGWTTCVAIRDQQLLIIKNIKNVGFKLKILKNVDFFCKCVRRAKINSILI